MKLQLNHRFFKKIILFLVFTLGGGFLFLDFHLDLDTSRVVVDRKGKLLSIELTGDDKFRYWQKLGEVETTYRDFILEKEDRYLHGGGHTGGQAVGPQKGDDYLPGTSGRALA